MKKLVRVAQFVCCLALILTLDGCSSSDATLEVVLNNPQLYEGLLISNTVGFKDTAGYAEKLIKDTETIHRFVEEMNGQAIVPVIDEDMMKRKKDLKEPGSYRVLLFDSSSSSTRAEQLHYFLFYKDGQVQVSQLGKTYFLENPNPDLLSEIISEWDIDF